MHIDTKACQAIGNLLMDFILLMHVTILIEITPDSKVLDTVFRFLSVGVAKNIHQL